MVSSETVIILILIWFWSSYREEAQSGSYENGNHLNTQVWCTKVVGSEAHWLRIDLVPVDEVEVLLAVSYVKIVIALLVIATISWQGACVVRCLYDIVDITVLHGFVISLIQRHWILMVDVQVRRVLIQEESAGASRWQSDCFLQVSVVLHVSSTEDRVTVWGFSQGNFIAEQGVWEEVEIITIRRLVRDAAVAFVSIQVD